MDTWSRSSTLLAACLWLVLAATSAAAAPPDAEQARHIAEQFVAGKQAEGGNPQESYETGDVVPVDLDGDGQHEIVVLWTLLGPTYWSHGLAVLARQGTRYVPSGEAQEALGSVEGMSVSGGVIQLKTKWPGPNDPRCCPTVAKTLRYRWTPGKLTPVK
ncbi:LppP/LprE family lipoprotein [Pseudoxanthomonas mexicana]|uniref:LppP/LprE family lipoprotein n=1 Tax=Pseudoxanthomonas mexicana TaxID=128785 RepID=UPI001FD6D06C|nr:LppP/LprE family lipoprotein [Pseudoxanthomonas mexicana]UOV01666.1 LppP/LprE family lipoprotein [Pseudoxanthomonas mexicana]